MKSRFVKVAVEAALKAGLYAKSRKGKVGKVSYKGAINLVTDVDKKCEDMIVRTVKRCFPSHSILSEENYTKITPAEYRWIIDPLDGTTNFFRGLPIYSVSVALEHKDEIIAGVVYDPERQELFTAETGKGAFLNKRRIHVSSVSTLKRAFLVTGFAYNIRTSMLDNMDNFAAFIKRTLAVRRLGSAALDLCYVACGRFDGFWEKDLHPWDAAAGTLIVKEAGGRVTKFGGSPFSSYDKELLSSNSKIHKHMIRVLNR